VKPEPFRIEPQFVQRIWGMRSLAPLFPGRINLPEAIGEVWLTGVDCKVGTGPFAGKTLGEAWSKMGVGWRGTSFQNEENFPLLLKFIFPSNKLSIQVHPDDAYASQHEVLAGGRGKTEMWYVISAESGARLLAGLKPGTTKERFRAGIANQALEELLQSYEAHAGDTFFIPAGMPHTIGPGMVICEVQEYSDLTYRVYDYGRVDANGKPRELHVEKALAVIDFTSITRARVETRPLHVRGEKVGEPLVDCPFFSTFRADFNGRVHFRVAPGAKEQFKLWVFLEGEGEIGWSTESASAPKGSYGGGFRYKQGDCWFIPAEFGSHGFDPKQKTSILIARPGTDRVESRIRTDAH
jgi:mannose-6-phosphate isomerase